MSSSFSSFYSCVFEKVQEVIQSSSTEMARMNWRQAVFAFSSLVAFGSGQSSTSQPADGLTTAAGSKTDTIATATINGTPTTYSVAFTVPASADVGPNQLPNVKDPQAKQAQQLCPGYTASNVQRTKYGFTAALSLAGEAVRYGILRWLLEGTDSDSVTSTAPISRISH